MERDDLRRVALLVAASTAVLTAAFVGVVAAVSGNVHGLSDRVPFYVFGGAVVFVATIVALEDPGDDGVPILTATVGISLLAFALLALGGEGVIYALANPDAVLDSRLVVYFLAAALVCTGTAYWGVNHWREFTGTPE